MIADYSSYLELLAAVYTSMLLDVEALNKLWYPDGYYNKIQETLKSVFPEEEGEGRLNKRILDASKQNAEKRNNRMRHKALFMLALTSLLLVFIGYESSFSNCFAAHQQWYNAVLITYFVGALVFFCGGKLFDQWNKTVILLLVVIISMVILRLFSLPPIIPISETFHSIAIVVLVTAPVLWELFSRWLFSSVYSGYLRSSVQKVKNEFDSAMRAFKNNDKKHVPRVYKRLINESIYSASSDKSLSLTDICIQGYMDIRNTELMKKTQYPNGMSLFLSWVLYTLKCILKRLCFWKDVLPQEVEIHGSYNNTEYNSAVVILNYQREYDEYLLEKAKNKTLSVKQFCQQHGYDFKAMVTWIKQRNNS